MTFQNNYYANAFFWSTLQKILSAIVGFISVPLLLGYYGKADYGLLTIATSCNGYMNLLDLGMNTGAVRFFSQWRAEGQNERINHVARTNLFFYGIIALINIIGLIMLAWFGESLFSITHTQFIQLRYCLYILAIFCLFSWLTTSFNQLLIADKQMSFTMQVQSLLTLGKCILIGTVFLLDLSLTSYFFWQTLIVAVLIIPYAIKCRKDKLIDNIAPALYWVEFKPVFAFSLSIFALSFFQMTATQTRPIILSMFAVDGASTVADFQIISVIPQFIIMIGGTFSSIFLPKTSEMVTRGNLLEQHTFAYKWTMLTSIVANFLCFPFIIGAQDIIKAYVGSQNAYLSIWMIIWVVSTLLQIHSTPTNALILAYGKMKMMVFVTGGACVISLLVNALFTLKYGVGSAIIGYSIYIVINLLVYYGYYYKKILKVSNLKILSSFLKPTICGVMALIISYIITNDVHVDFFQNERIDSFLLFTIKTIAWGVFYILLILLFKVIRIKGGTIVTEHDK